MMQYKYHMDIMQRERREVIKQKSLSNKKHKASELPRAIRLVYDMERRN